MKITIEIELDEREEAYIRTCSLERVMNNALWIAQRVRSDDERVQCALDDIPDAMPIASKLWNAARNAIFIERSK